jgi:hypothetical protein
VQASLPKESTMPVPTPRLPAPVQSTRARLQKARAALFAMLACAAIVLFPQSARATPPPSDLSVVLPDSIYTMLGDDPSRDQDGDGLVDDFENRLAEAWRPFFLFDEKEANAPTSLQDFEPIVLYQVRPMGWDWPRRIQIRWGFIYRFDGGFRGSWAGGNSHPGDTQGGHYELKSWNGSHWFLDKMHLWEEGTLDATDPRIEWTAPRGTYFGMMPDRPSPRIHASAGKHHQYLSFASCEASEHSTLNEDCDGGAERLADLYWKFGKFHNVGALAGPRSTSFVDDLGAYYAGERVWHVSYFCDGKPTFTGGMGECSTITDSVASLFDWATVTPYPRADATADRFRDWSRIVGLGGKSPLSVGASGGRGWIFEPRSDGGLEGRADSLSLLVGGGFDPFDLGGLVTGEVATATRIPGQLDLFVRGSQNILWTKAHQASTNSFWPSQTDYRPLLGAYLADSPSVASMGATDLDVFGRTDSNRVAHWKWRGAGWGSAEDLGGSIGGKVAAVSRKPGVVDVFVRDAWTGQLCTKSLSRTTSYRFDRSGWSWTASTREDWTPSIDGYTCFADTVIGGSPTVVSSSPDRIDVFARDPHGSLIHKTWNGAWQPALPGVLAGIPIQGDVAAVARTSGAIDIAALGLDGQVLHNAWSGSTWRGVTSFGGHMAQVKLLSRSETSVELVGLGADLNAYRRTVN